ncbi:hypothetical protein M770_30585 (plasmid) [Pseudomonas aeruginosa VRFPA03]|jgi:hypothetical protein|nr:hypothetical protein M770_30585 [Pseudomonas aeruginosa VRFPA03]
MAHSWIEDQDFTCDQRGAGLQLQSIIPQF